MLLVDAIQPGNMPLLSGMLPDFFRFVKDPVQRTERIPLQTLASRTMPSAFCLSPATRWWRMTGSNRRPSACKADALPAELIPHSPAALASGY